MENEKKRNIITKLQDFLETEQGLRLLNYLYSWGAAIVIAGALFKLTHIKGADLMLWIGMGTEVLVFFISGFDRQASTMGGGKSEGSASVSGPVVIGGGVPLSGSVGAGAPAIDTDAIPVTANAPAGNGGSIDADALSAMANIAAANAAAAAAKAAAGGGANIDAEALAAMANLAAANVAAGNAGATPTGEDQPVQIIPEGTVVGAANQPIVIGEAPTIIGEGGTVNIPEVEKVTTDYIDRLHDLSEMLNHVAEQMKNLEGSADEMERLSRNLTSINTIYELHLKSLGSQIGNIDNVNEQTQRMADQIEELNSVYKRMLESMTVNMGVRGTASAQSPEE